MQEVPADLQLISLVPGGKFLMALIVDETFATNIPGGFATVSNGSQTLSASYNAGQLAADLTLNFAGYGGWILNNYSTATNECEVEVDMELVSGAGMHFGVGFSPQTVTGTNTFLLSIPLISAANGSGAYWTSSSPWNRGTSADVESGFTRSLVTLGTRRTYMFRTKLESNGYRYFETLINGVRLNRYYLINSNIFNQATVRPALFIEATSASPVFRIHSVKAWDLVSTSFPAIDGISRDLPPGRILMGSQANGTIKGKLETPPIYSQRIYFSGTASVQGKILNNFAGLITKVRLHDKNTGIVVAQTASDSTGYYSFTQLENNRTYYTVFEKNSTFISPPVIEYYGNGLLSGIYRIEGVATPNAILRVFAEDTHEYLGQVQTNASGLFTINNLNTTKQFYIVVRDPNSLWEDRVSSRRTPV